MPGEVAPSGACLAVLATSLPLAIAEGVQSSAIAALDPPVSLLPVGISRLPMAAHDLRLVGKGFGETGLSVNERCSLCVGKQVAIRQGESL